MLGRERGHSSWGQCCKQGQLGAGRSYGTLLACVKLSAAGFRLLTTLAQVSGKHARLEAVMDESVPKWNLFAKKQSPVKYYVTDLSSTNGTFLNR